MPLASTFHAFSVRRDEKGRPQLLLQPASKRLPLSISYPLALDQVTPPLWESRMNAANQAKL
jgi:hypothetical protein